MSLVYISSLTRADDDHPSYRDAKHSTTTPFEDTLGPLRGEIEILSLRTCKADVCVGLKEGMEARLDAEDKNWRVGGKSVSSLSSSSSFSFDSVMR